MTPIAETVWLITGCSTGFGREIRLIHLRAEARQARLEARRLQRAPAAGASAKWLRSGGESVHDRREGIGRREKFEACRAGARAVHAINFPERLVLLHTLNL